MPFDQQLQMGDVVETKVYNLLDDQLGINVRHWQVGAVTGPGAQLSEAATALEIAVEPAYKALMAGPTSFRGVGARVIDPALSLEVFSNTLTGLAAGGITPLPKQVAGFISFRTDTAGRRGRGRLYIPFPSTDHVEPDGNPTAAYLGIVQLLANTYSQTLTVMGGGGGSAVLSPVLWGRALKIPTLITRTVVPDRFATQRRRGDFGPTNVSPI